MSDRLPSYTARDVDRVLVRLGFTAAHQNGSHRHDRHPRTEKIAVGVPMHPGDLPRWLLKKIDRDVGLIEDQFRSAL